MRSNNEAGTALSHVTLQYCVGLGLCLSLDLHVYVRVRSRMSLNRVAIGDPDWQKTLLYGVVFFGRLVSIVSAQIELVSWDVAVRRYIL